MKIAVGGCGVLGLPVIAGLSRMGVAEIRILDRDVVEKMNLVNNPFFQERHVGIPKSKAAAEVARVWSLRKVKARSYHFNVADNNEWGRLNDFVAGMDLVYGCFDNLPARFSLNSAAITHGVKLIDLGVEGFSGRVRLIDSSRACYACDTLVPEHLSMNIFSLTEKDGEGCDYAPTVTILPTAMLTAAHAIMEGLKFLGILKNGDKYDYLYYDFLMSEKPVKMQITKRKDCLICGQDGLVNWQ